jgi:hypothetical protein
MAIEFNNKRICYILEVEYTPRDINYEYIVDWGDNGDHWLRDKAMRRAVYLREVANVRMTKTTVEFGESIERIDVHFARNGRQI